MEWLKILFGKKNSRTPTALFIGSLLLYIYLFNSYIHISFSLRHTRTKHSMLYIKKGFHLLCRFQSQSEIYRQHFDLHTHCAHTHLNTPQTTAYGLMPWFDLQSTDLNGKCDKPRDKSEAIKWMWAVLTNTETLCEICRKVRCLSLRDNVSIKKTTTQKCTLMCITHATWCCLFFSSKFNPLSLAHTICRAGWPHTMKMCVMLISECLLNDSTCKHNGGGVGCGGGRLCTVKKKQHYFLSNW